jgi:hypothetical protein
MFRRDYIMKMIEEMAQVLGTIIAQLERKNKHLDAFEMLEGFFSRLYLPKSKVLVHLSEADLLGLFRTNDIVETDKMDAAVLLLRHEADLLRKAGKEEEAYYRDATALLLTCEALLQSEAGAPENAERQRTADALAELLAPFVLPLHVMKRFVLIDEQRGRFDQAENHLFRLAEAGDVPDAERPFLLAFGEAFYARLLAKADAELEAGGLPRSEAEDGLRSLRRLLVPRNG